jgi:hypothetical protein
MSDIFKLFGNIMLACFKITGYFFVFVVQVILHLVHRQTDKIGDDFGYLGRGTTDAIAGIFK